MALITQVSPSLDASQAYQSLAGKLAGEALLACAPCYIKTSDGLIYMSNGTSANEAAEVVGFTARAVGIGQPVTLYGPGTRFRYGSGLTDGNVLYLGATAGRLDSASTTGDAFGYAMVIGTTDIIILRSSVPALVSATVGANTITTAELADDAVATANILAANVTEAKIEVGAAGAGLSGLVAKFVASGNVIGGIPVLHHILMVAGANGDTNITLTHKTRVCFIIVHPRTSVASAVVTVKSTGNAISDAIVAAVAGVTTFCGSLSVTYDTIAAGGVLRATGSGGATQPDCDVYVLGFRVA